MTAFQSHSKLRAVALLASALPLFWAASCNGGSGGGGMIGSVGEELAKPDGSGTFFNEKNSGGTAGSLKLLDVSWGRLVDVHDIDATTGKPDPSPVFRDFVINETIQSDGQNYLLDTNPVTQRTRLVILRERVGDPLDEFTLLLKQAEKDLSPIQTKSDKPGTLPPFSFIARNSALVLRFNDLLDDSEAAILKLPENVRILTDYPPNLPYQNRRAIFDANHGGLAGGGAYHSTRLILDLTVSESEAASMLVPTGLNSLGLPPSLTTTQQANVSIRIPSKTDPATGQFTRLTNLSKNGMSISDDGPVDFGSPTLDVVRAMRSGNPTDGNNGFLLDLNPPQLVSGWPITVSAATQDPNGEVGFEFVVDIIFSSSCRAQPEPGNIIELPGLFAEVSTLGLPPDGQGKVSSLEIRTLAAEPISSSALLGGALFKRTYDGTLFPASLQACWLSFAPLPGTFPASQIDPSSQVILRFSEPMDPLTVTSFDTFRVQTTDLNPEPNQIIVGDVNPSGDLKEFTFTPLLPFDHTTGSPEALYISLVGEDGITDLAGNAPTGLPGVVQFALDSDAPTVRSGGITLTFDTLDEVKHTSLYLDPLNPPVWEDWRGQYLYDIERNLYKPRSVVRSAAIADRSQAVPGIMIPFGPGVQTPLAPLGSKLMTVWRYCDVGFSSQDESNFNMDVEGLNWSPIGAQIVSDYYPEFEIRLSHSHYQPDEVLDPNLLPDYPASGLTKTSFAANILSDPISPQKIVHPRGLGYVLNPVDLFLTSTGTFMMPYPLNRDKPASEDVYYTWRDTTIQAKAAPNGDGIDLGIMETVGLIPAMTAGDLAIPNQVPSLGLPLLMEFRTYPAEEGIGLNAFDISLAINTSRLPAFRIFSTGGLNKSGILISKDPDLEVAPSGGFNPSSTPTPGAVTPPDDNSFYIGQMDLITRISRLHSIWFDTAQSGGVTDFLDPVVQPTPEQQPSGSALVFAYRGASAIGGESIVKGKGYSFRADHIDPYGDVRKDKTPGIPEFIGSLNDVTYLPSGDKTWKDDIDQLDQARYFQIRATFVGNTTTLLNSEFSGIGVAWSINN